MKSIKIQPVVSTDFLIDIACDCGKVIQLSTGFGNQPSFCGHCEKAFYLKNHDGHFHVKTKDMCRGEILQQSYGKLR